MLFSKYGDIIVLEDGKTYQVMGVLEHEGNGYLYIMEAPNELVDAVSTKDLKTAYVKEVIDKDTEEFSIEPIEDKALLKTVKAKITDMIKVLQ